MPEKLRKFLLERGHSTLEVGDLRLDLRTGRRTREIKLDGRLVAALEVWTTEIDWADVEEFLREELK
jgi:hypothetical protein